MKWYHRSLSIFHFYVVHPVRFLQKKKNMIMYKNFVRRQCPCSHLQFGRLSNPVITVFYLNFSWHPSECPFRTSNTHNSYMISEFFTRPKHDFTRLGRVDGWLGRTLHYPVQASHHDQRIQNTLEPCSSSPLVSIIKNTPKPLFPIQSVKQEGRC